MRETSRIGFRNLNKIFPSPRNKRGGSIKWRLIRIPPPLSDHEVVLQGKWPIDLVFHVLCLNNVIMEQHPDFQAIT